MLDLTGKEQLLRKARDLLRQCKQGNRSEGTDGFSKNL